MSKQISFTMYLEVQVVVDATYFPPEKVTREYPGCPDSIEDLTVCMVKGNKEINILPCLSDKDRGYILDQIYEEVDRG